MDIYSINDDPSLDSVGKFRLGFFIGVIITLFICYQKGVFDKSLESTATVKDNKVDTVYIYKQKQHETNKD